MISNWVNLQCGLSSSESNQKAQDDLVSLFRTHMNMGPTSMTTEDGIPRTASPSPITYSVTQHYHHSAHVAHRACMSGPVQGNTSSRDNEVANHSLFDILKYHNILPSSLSSSQLELFAEALPEQQVRLIQMWQICPEPSKGSQWPIQPTQAALANDLEMSDSTHEPNNGGDVPYFAEPYMLAGYELVRESEPRHFGHPANEPTTGSPYRICSDPVYQGGAQRWWERTQPVTIEY